MTIQIARLKAPVAEALEEEGWTVEKLAMASEKDLTPISGIGKYTARYIISQAREIINAQRYEYSVKADEQIEIPRPTVEPTVEIPEPKMSARVKLIAERMDPHTI